MKNTSKRRSSAAAERGSRSEPLKFGRNESCPCGSGKKYKSCCDVRLDVLLPKGGEAAGAHVNVPALLQTAIQHHNAGLLREAEDFYRQVLKAQPRHPDGLHLLGLLAAQTGNMDDASVLVSAAIVLHPLAPDYYNTLANCLIARGRLDQAEALLQRALEIKPDHAQTFNNLGNVHHQRGHLAEAIACYEKAGQLAPDAAVYNNMAGCHLAVGHFDEAIDCAEKAVALNPKFDPAWINLGAAFKDTKRLCQALEAFHRAIGLNDRYAPTWVNLAGTLTGLGRMPEALESYGRAMALDPGFVQIRQNYLMALNYAAGFSPQALYEEHLEFARRFEAPLKPTWKAHANDPVLGRKLRLGYVSGDFRKHAVTYFFEPVLARHDPARFEIFLYSNNLMEDATTERLKGRAQYWREITKMSDEAVADLIRRDGIDILVDLAGHSAGNRLLVFARKPAPVQVNWLGYLCTTGLATMGYRITDPWADPPGMTEGQYTEELVRLPDSFVCYEPAEAPPAGPLPALAAGHVTFASFNNLAKVTSEVISLWARVLHAVPGSRLLLKAGGLSEPCGRDPITQAFASHDISPERLDLVAWDASYEDHIARYNQADVALDPFPCNGGTTSFDALWMGLPVISLAGDRFLSRMGVSMLNNLGLQELIADDQDEYVQIAANLAGDLERLEALRGGLRERMRASPLIDADRFTRNLEQAYRDMWCTWCEGYTGQRR